MFTRLALLDHFEDAPQLARLAQSAVALYPQEPNIVLIRLRQFGEAVLQYLAERWQLDTGGLDTPLDVLRLLDYKLLAPEKIIDTLNELRVKGNQAVHDLHEDPADAAANLQHAETVAQWLYDTFILPEQLIAERARREAEDQAAHAAAKERAALEAKDLAKFLAEEEKQAAKARKQAKREGKRAERAIEKAERKAQIAAEKQQRVRQYEEKTRLRRARQQEYQRRVRRAEALYEEGQRFKAGRDYVNAVRCFSEAAEIGSARSMVQMGLAYSNGWLGKKDAAKAFYWNSRAAQKGDVDGVNNLAICYADGEGVAADPERAMRLYRQAARDGYAIAQHNLGCEYRKGRITKRNLKQAVVWYKRAAAQGIYQSDYWLGIIYEYRSEPDKAVRHMRRAAKRNYADAIEWLRQHGLSPSDPS